MVTVVVASTVASAVLMAFVAATGASALGEGSAAFAVAVGAMAAIVVGACIAVIAREGSTLPGQGSEP